MITGQWHPHKNSKDSQASRSVDDIIADIADRAFGGYCDFNDDPSTYPRMILNYYTSQDCPEPLNDEDYQRVMRENDERVHRAIWLKIHNRIY